MTWDVEGWIKLEPESPDPGLWAEAGVAAALGTLLGLGVLREL